MHHFTVLDSEQLCESPILAVRSDMVEMPGASTAHREIVEHFGAVAIVALDQDQRLAMVKQYRHSLQRRLWEIPAGLLDKAGEDPLSCARRELREEAGLSAGSWQLLLDVASSPGFCDEVIRVYLAQDLQKVEQPPREDEELDMEVTWVDLTEAHDRVLAGEIYNSTAIAAILSAYEVCSGRGHARPVTTPFDLRPHALSRRRQARGITPDMKRIHD